MVLRASTLKFSEEFNRRHEKKLLFLRSYMPRFAMALLAVALDNLSEQDIKEIVDMMQEKSDVSSEIAKRLLQQKNTCSEKQDYNNEIVETQEKSKEIEYNKTDDKNKDATQINYDIQKDISPSKLFSEFLDNM